MRYWGLAAAPLVLSVLAFSSAQANVIYDPGTLGFESSGQSMWGAGEAFRKEESVFVGAQWTDKTATIGGIAGSENAVVIPASDPVYTDVYEPRIWVPTPTWSNPLKGYHTGCGCWKSVKIWPGTDAITADTRTGAELNLHSSGKIGLNFGYGIDSGSVDTAAVFGAAAVLPDTVEASQFFSIGTSSKFDAGKILTQSPKLEAYISSVVQFSGSLDAQICALTQGCASGSTPLPSVAVDQRIVSIDPGSFKILDGLGPEGHPIVEAPILNQSLTLEGSLTYVPPAEPVPGFKLTGPGGITIVSSVPPTPSVNLDLAELSLNIPDIATKGSGGGPTISSNGRDDLLSLQLDLDGAATMFGGLPPAGLGVDLIDTKGFKLGVHFDFLDADAGPVLGVTQDFNFTPTLMTTIDFSNPVAIAGQSGLFDSWTGKWSDLPDFAITQDTTFTPIFWLDASLQNKTGLDLGLTGTLDFLKLSATANVLGVDLLKLDPLSLNNLLGISNELFSTPKLGFDVFDKTFALGGFNMITGPSFTLSVSGQAPVISGASIGSVDVSVPEPGTLWLFAPGLLFMLPGVRRRLQRAEA